MTQEPLASCLAALPPDVACKAAREISVRALSKASPSITAETMRPGPTLPYWMVELDGQLHVFADIVCKKSTPPVAKVQRGRRAAAAQPTRRRHAAATQPPWTTATQTPAQPPLRNRQPDGQRGRGVGPVG